MDTDKYKFNKKYEMPSHLNNNTITLEVGKETNTDNYMEYFGVDMSKRPDAYATEYIKCVQKRTHKKRKINKKWAKRYGYTAKLVKGNGWKFKTGNGYFEFAKDYK